MNPKMALEKTGQDQHLSASQPTRTCINQAYQRPTHIRIRAPPGIPHPHCAILPIQPRRTVHISLRQSPYPALPPSQKHELTGPELHPPGSESRSPRAANKPPIKRQRPGKIRHWQQGSPPFSQECRIWPCNNGYAIYKALCAATCGGHRVAFRGAFSTTRACQPLRHFREKRVFGASAASPKHRSRPPCSCLILWSARRRRRGLS